MASLPSSSGSKNPHDSTFIGGNGGSQGPPRPYHITHGATAYQQIMGRTQSQPLLFSSSGFDIIGVLTRVAARPNPTVFIGPVDFSCAFVVADTQAPDFPIVYASPPLATMTGYDVAEFIGQSCRFLQWPNGGKGRRESHPSNAPARAEIKQALLNKTECQSTLINYRKNGEMFVNFVTIVPITWDSPEVKYFVGFQVDISEPARLHTRNLSLQNINVLPSSPEAPISDSLKALITPAESVEERRESFFDFLVNNVDDFILALSSDGIIHQAMGRVEESIGWQPKELVGRNIASFIHPADVDKVHNELASFRFIPPAPRTSSSVDIAAYYTHQNRIVHILYRAFLNQSAPARVQIYHPYKRGPLPDGAVPHIWLESSGRIYIESATKAFLILSTRTVHIPQLTYSQIEYVEGFGLHEAGIWARVSLNGGIILSVSSRSSMAGGAGYSRSPKDVEDVLGVPQSALVGTQLHDWVSYEFAATIDSVLRDIRQGSAKRPASWSKPRQVTAMMPGHQSPTPDKTLAFGKPIVITIFPPDSLNAPPTPPIPVYTPVRPQDECVETPPHDETSPGTRSTSEKERDVPPLPASLLCRISSPLHVLPDGMLSPTGAPRTNQAYLYDPFGAFRPQRNAIPNMTSPRTSPITSDEIDVGSSSFASSSAPAPPLPQRQGGSTGDIFGSLAAFADPPNGAPRWEDQLETLRIQNARMQLEIDELLSAQKHSPPAPPQ